MGYNLPKRAKTDIIALARRCGLKKVILFGSRARGDNWERSDIDLAVSGGDTAILSEVLMMKSDRCSCLIL